MTAIATPDLRVLLVEDEPDIREIAELSLGLDPSLETRSCASGREALALAADWRPDLILLDVVMPVMDGPATLAHLRRHAQTVAIPVVFMTARTQARDIELFRSLGAAGVIAKPFDPLRLAASVRAHASPASNRIDALRADFMQRLQHDAVALMSFWSALQEDSGDAVAHDSLCAIAHGLAGAGGIYGFSAVSETAADLEQAVLARRDGEDGAPIAAALGRLLGVIAAACARA